MITLLPIFIPLLVIVLLLFTRSNLWLSRSIALAGTLGLLVVSVYYITVVRVEGILVNQAGAWEAPFGISIVIDRFSAIMVLLSSIIAFCVTLYSFDAINRQRQQFHYFLLVNGLLMGVNGAFTTGDVFNLYVWFEVMIMSSFVLITLGNEKKQLQGAIKYVTINLVSSMFFLAGIGLLYAKVGTLNMADLAYKLRFDEQASLINSSAMLFFVAFSIKSAVFPFFFWLPASYHTPPVAITALFAGLLTKVGVYSMIRLYTLFFVDNTTFWHPLILVIGGLTMVTGVITAASQYDIRKILSFHIISQIGYMLMGLGLFTVTGLAGAVYFMAHNIIAKTNTFLVGGIMERQSGSFNVKKMGGLYKQIPLLGILFLIPALSLAGLPPLSGFFGKYILIKAGFEANQYMISAVAILVSLITLFSMIKIWNEAFWKDKPEEEAGETPSRDPKPAFTLPLLLPTIFLALLTIAMGVFAGPIIGFMIETAQQLIQPHDYIHQVLKGGMK